MTGMQDLKKLIEMPYGDSTVIVAVDVPEEAARAEIRKVGAETYYEDFTTPQKVEEDFGLVSDMIYRCSKPIIESFERLGKEKIPPKKATADFALSFNGKGKIYVVEASMEGSIKVSFEWDLEKHHE
jgi:hypothetical protein